MKISILTPSFNSANYIERAIKSVLNQNYNDWEHIIMDGGSTDTTIDILKRYPHIIWKSEKDRGQSDAMNKAFKISTGDIIAYLNADDYFENDIFLTIIDEFRKNTFDILVGKGKIVDENGLLDEWNPETSYWKILLHFKYRFPLNPTTYFYRRHVQIEIGGYNVDNHFTMDYEFLLSVYKNYKVMSTPAFLGNFYFDGKNKTATINPILSCRKTAINFCKQKHFLGLIYYKFNQYLYAIQKRKIDRKG